MATTPEDIKTQGGQRSGQRSAQQQKPRGKLVEMNWDPVTRIVGSLGIFTKIDFDNREVTECYSTSSIFRGYSLFLKDKDPRDTHFITSRICGICGDNHATCSVYAQNMAYGIKPPPLADWIINLGEAAEYMFDHNIFQDNMVGVDYCEKMVRETNPGVWEKAKDTEAPHAELHGYRTIGDIMRALNPFEGELYRETLLMSRTTREMFSLMEGRHVHPSTLYPGGVGTVPSPQLFTEYLSRLTRYVEFMKKVVPLHDDLFDFFYEAMPGYEQVGNRRVLLGCWGAWQDPGVCDYRYETMSDWGRAMYVTPGVVVDGKLVTTDLVDINLQIRILLGSSFYDGWEDRTRFVEQDPLETEARDALLARFIHDEHINSLLLLHDLHPQDLQTRVQGAIERLRPHLAVLGFGVVTLSIDAGLVHLVLRETESVPQSPTTPDRLRSELEAAIVDAAPDAVGIEIEGLPSTRTFVAAPKSKPRSGAAAHG